MRYTRARVFNTDGRPSVEQLCTICAISARTARRWLSGESTIPAPMQRLVELELNGRIMPESWPNHWHFNSRDLLETETCHEALGWQQMTWYQFVIGAWFESVRVIPQLETAIAYLMDKLPSAQVVELKAHREQVKALQEKVELSLHPSALIPLEAAQPKQTQRLNGC